MAKLALWGFLFPKLRDAMPKIPSIPTFMSKDSVGTQSCSSAIYRQIKLGKTFIATTRQRPPAETEQLSVPAISTTVLLCLHLLPALAQSDSPGGTPRDFLQPTRREKWCRSWEWWPFHNGNPHMPLPLSLAEMRPLSPCRGTCMSANWAFCLKRIWLNRGIKLMRSSCVCLAGTTARMRKSSHFSAPFRN